MLNPSDFGLQSNPFPSMPSAEVEIWAGLPETKKHLEDVVVTVQPDDVGASEFVVIHGNYGAGKSHAMRYFTHRINKLGKNKAIYLSEIRSGKGLSFSVLCGRIRDQLDEDETKKRIVETVKRSIEERPPKAIEEKIPHPDREMVRFFCREEEIPELGKDDYSATKDLGVLFRVITSSIDGDEPAFGAIYLFLDEVECVMEEKALQQIAFFNALRSLLNEVTEHFALVLSFSTPTAMLEAVVPEALQQRMTRQYIECQELDTEEAKKFVQEYLSFVRPDNFSPPQPFYPFSEAAINTIFEREPTLVPRTILRHLRRVWERAARHGNLQPGHEISREMADEILTGII